MNIAHLTLTQWKEVVEVEGEKRQELRPQWQRASVAVFFTFCGFAAAVITVFARGRQIVRLLVSADRKWVSIESPGATRGKIYQMRDVIVTRGRGEHNSRI